MSRGEHIYILSSVGGVPFQHHGIDMGDGTVIHLAPEQGVQVTLRDESGEFSVRRDSLEDFCRGAQPQVVEHDDGNTPEEVARVAEENLGRQGYSLLDGNCEHFATYCATGRFESHQIEMSEATVSALASMATKACWSLSSKWSTRLALRSAVKVHPAAMLADGVEIALLTVGCQAGLDARRSRRMARLGGTMAALGIGGVVGGPGGAALCVAAHTSSGAVADQVCKTVRRLLG